MFHAMRINGIECALALLTYLQDEKKDKTLYACEERILLIVRRHSERRCGEMRLMVTCNCAQSTCMVTVLDQNGTNCRCGTVEDQELEIPV
jgi:hypothetical protein